MVQATCGPRQQTNPFASPTPLTKIQFAGAGKTWSYPATYFMHMELDRATAQRVTADINVLKTKQVGHRADILMLECVSPIGLFGCEASIVASLDVQ